MTKKTSKPTALTLLFLPFLIGLALTAGVSFADTPEKEYDFSSGLGSDWVTGTNYDINESGPEVGTYDGKVVYPQMYDYIQSNFSSGLEDDFLVEMQVGRNLSSSLHFDYVVELVGYPEHAGSLRLRIGSHNFAINIGTAPGTTGTTSIGDGVDDGDYYVEANTYENPQEGVITMAYKNESVKFSFEHVTAGKIETPWVSVGDNGPTQVRIWCMGSGTELSDEGHWLDNVKIYSPSPLSSIGSGAIIYSDGSMGISTGGGTPLYVLGNVTATGGFLQGSSRSIKKNIRPLDSVEAVKALRDLYTVHYQYKEDRLGEDHVGFIAEDVPDLVASKDRKTICPLDIVGVLTKVVQEQQKTIEMHHRILEQQQLRIEAYERILLHLDEKLSGLSAVDFRGPAVEKPVLSVP